MENINMSDVYTVVLLASFCGTGLYSMLDGFLAKWKQKKEAKQCD